MARLRCLVDLPCGTRFCWRPDDQRRPALGHLAHRHLLVAGLGRVVVRAVSARTSRVPGDADPGIPGPRLPPPNADALLGSVPATHRGRGMVECGRLFGRVEEALCSSIALHRHPLFRRTPTASPNARSASGLPARWTRSRSAVSTRSPPT